MTSTRELIPPGCELPWTCRYRLCGDPLATGRSGEELWYEVSQRSRLYELAGERHATGPSDGVLECFGPPVLDQQHGHRSAWRQPAAKLSEHVTWDPGRAGRERALGRPSSRGGIEPEIEQRRDHTSGAVAAYIEDDELAGLRVALDEHGFEDPQHTPGLEAPKRAPELAFEPRIRPESVNEKLRGWEHCTAHRPHLDRKATRASPASDELRAAKLAALKRAQPGGLRRSAVSFS